MTLLVWIACVALTYGPFFIVYQAGLKDANVFRHCGIAAIWHALSQLLKLVLVATFVPQHDEGSNSFSFIEELLFLLFSIVDVVGMYYSLSYLKRSNTAKHLKILTAAIGWGFAEALLGKFMPLWFDTRGVEFHWENVIMGLDANIRLVYWVTFSALVFAARPKNLSQLTRAPFFTKPRVLLLLLLLQPLISTLCSNFLVHGAWGKLQVDGFLGVTFAAVARQLL